VNLRQVFLVSSDRLVVALMTLLVLGSALSFGGAVWWFRPVPAVAAFLLVLAKLLRDLVAGRVRVMKSPLTLLGLLALGLAGLQLAPLPPDLARRLSPTAHEAYMRGVMPDLARADDPEGTLPESLQVRSPASLDRSATLHWLVGAAACLGIFWTVSHFTDRLGRLYLVWGLVIAGFLVNATLSVVQVTNGGDALGGILAPGSGPAWAPSPDDLLEAPGTAALRDLPEPRPAAANAVAARAVLMPVRPALFGTLVGGAGGFLALGAMAMPLATAIVLHLVSPRGSRESLASRLGQAGQGSLVLLLVLLLFLSALLVGLVAGSWQGWPLVLGLTVVGVPALLRAESRWPALGLIVLLLGGLGLGTTLRGVWPALLGGEAPFQPPGLEATRTLWSETLQVVRPFPWVGSGLGTFATIHPYFKDRDLSPSTSMSSLLQWAAESGAAGLAILALGLLWCLVRLPGSLGRVGRVDRSLAHGLIGAALSFSLFAAIHWTVELTAVAISASALGGTWNRWLAGGTDLFVEHG
jgi:hypothetical protein